MKDAVGHVATVVHVRDTLLADDAEPAGAFARPVFRVPGDTPVYEVLRRMREESVQLAVIDQGADIVGVVTLTDVVRRVLPAVTDRAS
jgi:CBS domain containing-hemolysin-like protein